MNDSINDPPAFWKMEPIYGDNGKRIAARHEICVDKNKYRISFKDESEDSVTIVLDPVSENASKLSSHDLERSKMELNNCTRCGNMRKTLMIFTAIPGMTLPLTEELPVPRGPEDVCSSCITDQEIVRLLGPTVEYVLNIMLKEPNNELNRYIETVRTIFAVRNNELDNRNAALRDLGLAD